MKNDEVKKQKTEVIDINSQRIKRKLIEQVDENQREEAEDFLKRFKDDTLTGR